MEGKENLYYALGQLAYAVAMADGEIQVDEKEKLHEIVVTAIGKKEDDYNISEIIFNVLKNEQMDLDSAYNWAIKDFKKYKMFLTDDMKKDFVNVIKEIAESFDSTSKEEQEVIDRFETDLKVL